jgi:hypothetical protein
MPGLVNGDRGDEEAAYVYEQPTGEDVNQVSP